MADASDLKSAVRKNVWVRIPPTVLRVAESLVLENLKNNYIMRVKAYTS